MGFVCEGSIKIFLCCTKGDLRGANHYIYQSLAVKTLAPRVNVLTFLTLCWKHPQGF